MDKFLFKAKAEILHLNVRKEGPEDDKNLTVDLKLSGKCDATLLDYFAEGLRPVLYTDVGAVKNPFMKGIGFSNVISNCQLTIIERIFHGVKFAKFDLAPCDNNLIRLTFTATFQPTSNDIAILSEFILDEVNVEAAPAPELDFSGAGGAQGSEEEGDALYGQAVALIRQEKRVSISLVQRHLKIGYNRAARLIEAMEVEGVVGPESGGKRKILEPQE